MSRSISQATVERAYRKGFQNAAALIAGAADLRGFPRFAKDIRKQARSLGASFSRQESKRVR